MSLGVVWGRESKIPGAGVKWLIVGVRGRTERERRGLREALEAIAGGYREDIQKRDIWYKPRRRNQGVDEVSDEEVEVDVRVYQPPVMLVVDR
jgi:hypothetical protein